MKPTASLWDIAGNFALEPCCQAKVLLAVNQAKVLYIPWSSKQLKVEGKLSPVLQFLVSITCGITFGSAAIGFTTKTLKQSLGIGVLLLGIVCGLELVAANYDQKQILLPGFEAILTLLSLVGLVAWEITAYRNQSRKHSTDLEPTSTS